MLSDVAFQHVGEITGHITDEYEDLDEENGSSFPISEFLWNGRSKDTIMFMITFIPVEVSDI